jgi:Leucine-rich repeat (LRR) protein
VLDLRNNRFTAFPRAIEELPRLEKLDLRWNDFDETDSAIARLEARGCRVLL